MVVGGIGPAHALVANSLAQRRSQARNLRADVLRQQNGKEETHGAGSNTDDTASADAAPNGLNPSDQPTG
jgi:hypothetical protein